ncbi:hypothetical protein KC328_g14 [Hortaea werneckii]|nr:hypothetical protein KC328_g14 [Hortaea werneckii]
MDVLRQQAVLGVPAEQIFPVQSKERDSSSDELPQIYRPSQIPLSMLMRNYLILLLRDGKHVIAFVLAAILMLSGVRLIMYPPQGHPQGEITRNTISGTEELSNGSSFDILPDAVLPSIIPNSEELFASQKEDVQSIPVSSIEASKMRQPIDPIPLSEEEMSSSFVGGSTAGIVATSTSSEASKAENTSLAGDTPVGLEISDEHDGIHSILTEEASASSQKEPEETNHEPQQVADAVQLDFKYEASLPVEHEESKSIEPSERVEPTGGTENSMHSRDLALDELKQSLAAPLAESTEIALEPEKEPKAVPQFMEEGFLDPSKVDVEKLQCKDIPHSSVDTRRLWNSSNVHAYQTGTSKKTFLLPETVAEEPQYNEEGTSLEDAEEGAQELEPDGEADGHYCEASVFSAKYARFEQCSIDGEGEHTDTSALL